MPSGHNETGVTPVFLCPFSALSQQNLLNYHGCLITHNVANRAIKHNLAKWPLYA